MAKKKDTGRNRYETFFEEEVAAVENQNMDQEKAGSARQAMNLNQSENPGLALVNFVFSGDNFLPWSHAIRRALKAKEKLKYITDDIRPEPKTTEYEQWEKLDCLVSSWILNSMTKELSEDFLYVETARDLWKELEQRFGEINGPLLYQLKRNISCFQQRNLSVTAYYTKLKRYWSELQLLRPIPSCECGASNECACNAFKKLHDLQEEDRLIQFLMGLSEIYDHVKNQILIMDPLPSLNKAYSMLIRVEKQLEVSLDNTVVDIASYSKTDDRSKAATFQGRSRKKNDKGIDKRFCTYCHNPNHTRNSYFKLVGYPEWYLELKKRTGNIKIGHANTAERNDDSMSDTDDEKQKRQMAQIVDEVYDKYQKMKHVDKKADFKGKGERETPIDYANEFTAFAGAAGFYTSGNSEDKGLGHC